MTPSDHQLKDLMPWKFFGQMTDHELKAVWLVVPAIAACIASGRVKPFRFKTTAS